MDGLQRLGSSQTKVSRFTGSTCVVRVPSISRRFVDKLLILSVEFETLAREIGGVVPGKSVTSFEFPSLACLVALRVLSLMVQTVIEGWSHDHGGRFQLRNDTFVRRSVNETHCFRERERDIDSGESKTFDRTKSSRLDVINLVRLTLGFNKNKRADAKAIAVDCT